MTRLTRESSCAPLDTTSGLDISGGQETGEQRPDWRGMDRQRIGKGSRKTGGENTRWKAGFGQRDEEFEGGRGGLFESYL